MKDSIRAEAVRLIAKSERRKKRAFIILILGLFATVSVFAMLTLPAITMEQEPTCGLTLHDHVEGCYEDVLICELGDSLPPQIIQTEVLTCTTEESSGHSHSESCYIEESTLTCTSAEEGHVHDSEICYTSVQTLSCSVAESEGHTHGDGCYETIEEIAEPSAEDLAHEHDESCYEAQLVCGAEVHAHSEDCFVENNTAENQACTLEAHAHDEACYAMVDGASTLMCSKKEHTHAAECNITENTGNNGNNGTIVDNDDTCGKIEHTHAESCYTVVGGIGTLTCVFEEHTHTESCNIFDEEIGANNEHYKCGFKTHEHTDDCYIINSGLKILICDIAEHTHTDDCIDESKIVHYDCGLAEHAHSNECYIVEHGIGTIICGLPEHTHDECTILEPKKPIICGKEEHVHTDDCYSMLGGEKFLNCAMVAHTHSDACREDAVEEEYNPYSCGIESHVHDGDCYKITKIEETEEYESENYRLELDCESEEDLMHVHNDECFKLYELELNCGLAHEHDNYDEEEGCYIKTELEWDDEIFAKELVCEEEEHVHNLYCMGFGQSLMMMPFALVGGYSSELEDFVTEVKVTKSNGSPVNPGDVVAAGDLYIMQVGFRETPGTAQFKYNDQGFLTYKLPDGILPYSLTIPPAGLVGFIKSSVNILQDIGTYTIYPDGRIEVRFYNVDRQGASIAQNFIDEYNNAFFALKLEMEFGVTSGTVSREIDFGNDVKITITVSGDAKLGVDKLIESFNKSTGEIKYLVTITARGGSVNSLVFEDVFKLGKADHQGGVIGPIPDRLELVGNFSIKKPDGTIATLPIPGPPNYSKANGTLKLNIPGVTLNAGESLEIRYTVKVPTDIYDDPNASYYMVANTVHASGKEENGEPVAKAEDDAYLQIPVRVVTK